jgi:hypothetical protein
MTNPGAAASYAIDYVSVYGVERVRAEMCESHRKAHQESGAAVRALGLVPS